VFVWGYGILGKGPDLAESIIPEMIPPVLFGRTEFRPSVAVTTVRCGLNHFAAITGEEETACCLPRDMTRWTGGRRFLVIREV